MFCQKPSRRFVFVRRGKACAVRQAAFQDKAFRPYGDGRLFCAGIQIINPLKPILKQMRLQFFLINE